MLDFLFHTKKEEKYSDKLNSVYELLKSKYGDVSDEKKSELSKILDKYGYYSFPYAYTLDNLTDAETLFCLEYKWMQNGVFKDGKFSFENKNISPLARNCVKDSSWMSKEGHDIKLINLAGLGNRNKEAGKFIDWLKQLAMLPTGNVDEEIFNTTIYLIPFHPREFGCAYLPKSSDVSRELLDKELMDLTGLDAKGQVQSFIKMAQLAGHPVIYDILPQTGRFSKAVLANPWIARWYDINKLQKYMDVRIDEVKKSMLKEYDEEDLDVVVGLYKRGGTSGDLSEHYKVLYDLFESKIENYKKELSNAMLEKQSQEEIHKKAKAVVSNILGTKPNKKLCEDDITKQLDIIQALIKEGLWPAPGGAWCSAGIPVYDKMSECGGYPMFKHFDYKGEDVTPFANLDCQTPYYFAYLENGTYNMPVIDYFVNYMLELQAEYNFDGFRVDHIDHVVDEVSEKDGLPISYRAPRFVLGKLNYALKSKIPYFATLAEYMLWDKYYREYHNDMGFDILWGNDIISQFEKTPEKITEDNQYLTNFNVDQGTPLSILKTYNNQDGEFSCIDQYPGQLGEKGALFKWFKYKFLPGGKFAQRPVLYVDGDESFTKTGIEHAIGEEVSMPRACNIEFFKKFNAIDCFVKNNSIMHFGEAQIIAQDEDGFAAWLITKEPSKTAYLVICNFNYPTESVNVVDENGNSQREIVAGHDVANKSINLPVDYTIVGEFVIKNQDFVINKGVNHSSSIFIERLEPSAFRLFELKKA